MANWSNTVIQLIGDKNNIEKAHQFIQSYIDENYLDPSKLMPDNSVQNRAEYSLMEIDDYTKEDSYIEIYGQGRWCAPSGFFKDVVNKFNLEIDYIDSENGADFCHIIQGDKNNLIEKQYSYWSIEHFECKGGASAFFNEINTWYCSEEDKNDEIEKLIQYYSSSRKYIEEEFE